MIKIQKGDIILVHSTSFLARGIQVFMNISRWLHLEFKPFYHKKITNHVGMGDSNNMIFEAVAKGAISTEINEAYGSHKGTTITVYRYPWTLCQQKSLSATYERLRNHPYQFVNFLSYIINIFTFGLVWIDLDRSVSDRVYCSEIGGTAINKATGPEFARTVLDKITHEYFKRYWVTSPYKVEKWCKKNCTLVGTYTI